MEEFALGVRARRVESVWLGGLDSNQDNQIQNLMYCQLYDLPAGGNKKGRLRDPRYTLLSVPQFVNQGCEQTRTLLARS
jgi:hypothetical protein